MSTIPFTNTTGDGEVPGVNPDATTDYFLVSDYNNDKNYWHSKVCEAIKSMSGDPEENFQIPYGGVVTNAGTSKVNSAERQHFNGTTYYYQVLDSYLGESDTDDLFVDSNPGDTVVKWGSFKMNGTTFADQRNRSVKLTSSDKNGKLIGESFSYGKHPSLCPPSESFPNICISRLSATDTKTVNLTSADGYAKAVTESSPPGSGGSALIGGTYAGYGNIEKLIATDAGTPQVGKTTRSNQYSQYIYMHLGGIE